MTDATSADLTTDLRNQAFEEIERVALLASSYGRAISEAAYRGDDHTMLVHLKQLRSCTITMIKIYKHYFDVSGEPPDGQDQPWRRHRQDQRPGDELARG